MCRVKLNQAELQALATSGALNTLSNSHRRRAAWNASGVLPNTPIFKSNQIPEGIPMIRSPSEAEETYADYASMGLTLGTHPLELLRPRLRKFNVITNVEAHQFHSGNIAHIAGLVVTRQRPATAKEVTFVTLEDETGNINLIVWKKIGMSQNQLLNGSKLLGVSGTIQTEDEVMHLIAQHLFDYTYMLNNLTNKEQGSI